MTIEELEKKVALLEKLVDLQERFNKLIEDGEKVSRNPYLPPLYPPVCPTPPYKPWEHWITWCDSSGRAI